MILPIQHESVTYLTFNTVYDTVIVLKTVHLNNALIPEIIILLTLVYDLGKETNVLVN